MVCADPLDGGLVRSSFSRPGARVNFCRPPRSTGKEGTPRFLCKVQVFFFSFTRLLSVSFYTRSEAAQDDAARDFPEGDLV